MKFYHSRLLWKYFVSYFCVLMIPLILLGFFVFDFFTNYLESDIIKNNRDMLNQAQNLVDSQIQEIKDISFRISSDPDLTPYTVKKNAYGGMLVVQALKNYKSTTNSIYDLFFYIRGDRFIYSPVSSYTPDRLMHDKYNYKDWNVDDFKKTINTSASPIIRSAEEVKENRSNEKFITFIVPIPVYEPSPYGTVIFQVKEKMLSVLSEGILKNYNGNIIIYDNSGQMVSSLKNASYMHLPEFKKLLLSNKGIQSKNVVFNGEQYLLSVEKSKRSNWTYMTLIPTREIMGKVSDMKWKVMAGLIVLLLLGSAVIYYLSFKQYNPIKQLKELAEAKWSGKIGNFNEIEVVRLIVNHLSDNNQNLSEQIQSSKTALRDLFLFKLLKGQIYNMEEFNAHSKEVQLSFTKPYFMVVMFCIHQTNGFRKDEFISFLERNLPDELEGYVKDSMDDNSVVLLLASEQSEFILVKNQMEALKRSIHEEWELQVTVGVGSSYQEPYLIGKSYMEALTAINYRLIMGNSKVICFSEISDKVYNIDDYPKKEIELLELALKREEIDRVADMIGKIIQYIKIGNISIFMARSLCYDVINTIIKTMFEMNTSKLINKDNYPDVIALLKFETVEELEYEVRRVCSDILQCIKENNKSRNVDLKTRIIMYIQDNYCNSSFSVQKLADNFEISASYLSRYFKEQTAHSVSDYVHGLRIKQAEELLKTSDESLQSIVYKVGYYDVSSFIRKFKGVSGLTPGEYRKMHKV
jgi:two-component system response regulator YesN